MKLNNLIGERFKEKPADCVIDSYEFCIRGGYIKYVANGIYSLFPPMRRITQKIEKIIREEMDSVGCQEVLFPVTLPSSLWEESGRYQSVGDELLRFKDRNGSQMVLGMTHEEAAVHLVREYGRSYARYPFSIYQIQTKFRDEARPRAGLIRVREFTMKDAYSFHLTQKSLEDYYQQMANSYNRIFAKVGIPEVISVKSDSGMIGGNVSHEYMLLCDAGEDSIVLCDDCGYSANIETAETNVEKELSVEVEELKKVNTPNCKTIEEVGQFLGINKERFCKAVIYQRNEDDSFVVVFIRGDYEVNETKLTNYLHTKVHPAVLTEDSEIIAGFCGPVGLKGVSKVIYDKSLASVSDNMCCGANEIDYHYVGLNLHREIGEIEYVDVAKIQEGGICPCCNKKSIRISRGIEVGNIFQLGTKYSDAMGLKYVDTNGEEKVPIMGCYGIGIGRLAASICEAHHDDYGPIWPISVAPWQVHICCMRADKIECKEVTDKIYNELQSSNVEVLYDDRKVSAGVMFSDADLLGIPIRIIAGPKNIEQGKVEILTRNKAVKKLVDIDSVVEEVGELIKILQKDVARSIE